MMRNPQQGTTTVQVAGDTDRSGAVLLLGGGLIFVNFLFAGTTAGQSGSAIDYLTGKTNTLPPVNWGPYLLLGLALLLLLMLAKFGGETGGTFAVLFLVAAWIVWILNRPAAISAIFGQKPAGK